MRTKKRIEDLQRSTEGLWQCVEDTRKMIYRLAEIAGYEFYTKHYPDPTTGDRDLVRRKKK